MYSEVKEHSNYLGEELFVVFQLNEIKFAAPVMQVQEVIKSTAVVRMPAAEEFVEGVVSIRGSVTPVINLKRRLKLSQSKYGEKCQILVVELNLQKAGFLVDHVSEVKNIKMKDVQEPPEMACTSSGLYIQGIVYSAEKAIILLDFFKVLSLLDVKLTVQNM